MTIVTLALNPIDPETWETYEVYDIRDFLIKEFEEWPSTARIYHKQVSNVNDVTPTCELDIERLGRLEGPFYVIVYPADAMTIIVAIVAIAVAAAAVLLKPVIPSTALRNTQNESPNNELSDRTNKARPMARIPDIFGTVRSTPDLISVPYKIFENNEEVEYSYMCIGRGYYDIYENEIKDDTTKIIDISGTSVEIYEPFTSPNSNDTPQIQIGSPIGTSVLTAVRSNSVNGQVLRAPNDQNIIGNQNIRFVYPNEIQNSTYDFTDIFSADDVLTIQNADVYLSYNTSTKIIIADNDGSFKFSIPSTELPTVYSSGKECVLTGALFNTIDADGFVTKSYELSGAYTIDSVNLITEGSGTYEDPYVYFCRILLIDPELINPKWAIADGLTSTDVAIRVNGGTSLYNLSGVYTILSVSDDTIVLSNPSSINPDWKLITETSFMSPILSTSGSKWIGPFVLDKFNLSQVFSNFVALNGIYKDDGKNQRRFDVECEIELTPINDDGSTRGGVETFQITVEGSATYRSTRAVTLKCNPTFTGRCKVRARRITPSDLTFEGSVVDEIKWRDCYSISPVVESHFGNVTTVQSVTYATSGALAVKERKLNMLVTRKIPKRTSGSVFTTELYPTNDAAEIISAVCLDRYIGNRKLSEIDFDTIYDTLYEVKTYFGTCKAAEFSYTFDSKDLSFEEIINAIADSVFCTAYRRGNIIKLSFEKETEDSTLLFNHRNKLPDSETRTIRFGNQDNFDGVSFQYIDPEDDAQLTYYIPEDRSAINPKEFESIGIRNKLQAYFHAQRMWNKILYQNTTTEFTATQEADLLVRNDRIIVADNTRTGTQDGEIISQNILELTLSQNVNMTKYKEYVIFLQLSDGTIESIPITQGSDDKKVLLSNAPRIPLALDDDLYARTTYMVVGNNDPRENVFLVSEKDSQNNFTSTIRAINYDIRYYMKDKDFINGLINQYGEAI